MVNHSSLDHTFAALADPTRRAILNRLALGEANVSEIAEPFSMSLPAVSKHLRVLEEAGLLERRKEGRTHHCNLRTEPLGEAVEWIEEARRFWGERLDALAQFLEQPDADTSNKGARPKRKPRK
jgi:DNA-binding transcriptional ArsR family regulator